MKNIALSFSTLLALISNCAHAEVIPSAYLDAANRHGVPPEILYAVAQQESNAKLNIGFYPWPWTLNIAGKGAYFSTRQAACEAAERAIKEKGEKSVDIGLTQQNWGYIGKSHYSNPCDALNPYQNLETGALELRRCFDKRGDWIEAAGCYHRPAGGKPAELYKSSISKRLTRFRSNQLSTRD